MNSYLMALFTFVWLSFFASCAHLRSTPYEASTPEGFEGVVASDETPSKKKVSLKASDLLVADNQSLEVPASLTSDQIQVDIATLVYALTTGYGGRNYVARSTFENAIHQLQSIDQSMTPSDFRDKIDAALWLIPDNHLKARLNGEHALARKAALAPIFIGRNAITDPTKTWEVRVDQVGKKRVLYISITAFPSHEDAVWNGFLEAVQKHLRDTDSMVLDLRGNGGGDDTFGYKLAELAFGGPFNHPIRRAYVSQTPETIALASNVYRLQALRLKKKAEPVPEYFEKLYQQQIEKFQLASSGRLPESTVVDEPTGHYKFNSKKGYSKTTFILIDHGCGSSCESTTDAFETNPWVKKVGVNTIGMIHFGDVGALLLPNSKIHVQISTKVNEYFDKRFIEKVGIKPHVEVPVGTDAYQFVKTMLLHR